MTGERNETDGSSTWLGASEHVFSSILMANRAALTSLGMNSGRDTPSKTGTRTSKDSGASDTYASPDSDADDWDVERTVEEREAIEVGDTVEFAKKLTDDDVKSFATASGDTNPLHLDDEYAEETRFEDRIVHGTLVSGLISAGLARLPGLVVYVSQETKFLKAVEIGDRLTARCEIVEDLGNDLFRLSTDILNEEEETVVDGEAVVLIEESPE